MSVKETKTAETIEKNTAKNKEIADRYAAKQGKKNINEVFDEARTLYNSNNPDERAMGISIAQKNISELAQLILYQEIYEEALPSTYDLVERTNDGYINAGNAKTYNVNLTTGAETYVSENFNPTKQTIKKLENWVIQMYDANGDLNSKARQFLKEQTLQQQKWIPYFISGKLNEFMNILRNDIYRAFKIYRFNHLCNLITTSKPRKEITGTADNLFDAMLYDVLPNIEKMYQLNSEYSYAQNSKYVRTCNPSDLIVITSNKIKSMLKNGILTQLYNANLMGTSKKTLQELDIVCLGNKIEMTDSDNVVNDTGVEWLDDNTIWVVDISKIKTVFQVNETASQYYAKNITLYLVSHIWYAMDILPWCKIFKYTNPNLSKLPN